MGRAIQALTFESASLSACIALVGPASARRAGSGAAGTGDAGVAARETAAAASSDESAPRGAAEVDATSASITVAGDLRAFDVPVGRSSAAPVGRLSIGVRAMACD